MGPRLHAWLIATVAALGACAEARDKRCQKPPYGDSPEAFASYQADADRPLLILQESCEAKFSRSNRAPFYAAGFTDVDIDEHSPVEIALQYGDALRVKLRQSATPTSIVDFALDGKQLATRAAFLAIRGIYIKQGNVEVLYADTQAVLQSRYNPEGTPPRIPLLTDDASREFRKHLLACQAHPTYAQVGCPVTIWGNATTCTLTNAFGTAQEQPCIHVVDGE